MTTQTNGKSQKSVSSSAGSTAGNVEKSGDWSGGDGILPDREDIRPLFVMMMTPAFAIIFYHVCAHMSGDFLAFAKLCMSHGFFSTLYAIWPTPWDAQAWKILLGYMAFELTLQKYLPGKTFRASLTLKGNAPIYKANGVQAYLISLGTLLLLTHFELIRPAVVYDKFGNLLSSMNVFAFLFCTMLLIKGRVAPSSTDSGSNGSGIYDFYCGMELYPRIFGWDVKMFTKCRFGMMFWAIGPLCFAHKNMEVNGGVLNLGMAVNVALQLIYVAKFFYWESGYLCRKDTQHDRAGYRICWGCLVWLPMIYTSHSFYLAENAPEISTLTAAMLFFVGFLMIFVNYDSDNQRYVFRQNKGECKIFGKVPRKIVAKYTTDSGDVRTSLLLLDGYWKVSRHFHYVPEILASLCWSLPALNSSLVGPYFYVFYLTILLTDRAFRDDDRCRKKYGKYWDEYCAQVPYKIIPGLV